MLPAPGSAMIRIAAVIPVVLIVLFTGLLWLLGLSCGPDRRRYVTDLSRQATDMIGVLLPGGIPAEYSAPRFPHSDSQAHLGPEAGLLSGEGGTVKTSGPMFDLFIMTGLTAGRWFGASAGAVTAHVLAWPYTAAILAVTAAYRLLAERVRRKTLVDLVSHAPAGTIVVMEKGPGGPAMWVRVGDGLQFSPHSEVRRGR